MKAQVPVNELCIGMFVDGLDRSWLGTPFLLQGFLLEDAGQLEWLCAHCQTVSVDYARSTISPKPQSGKQPSADPFQKQFPMLDAADQKDFIAICRLLRNRSPQRYPKPPVINATDGQSRLEAELLYSAPIIDDIKTTLAAIASALDPSHLDRIAPLVNELAQSVQRNPDALLWLTRLKSTDQYSYDHAVDVSIHLMMLCRFLNLPEASIQAFGLAGMLQDIGKIKLPQEILNKPSALTSEEYALVQSHVASSLEILKGHHTFTPEMLEIVAGHHERHDGSGYPRRLAEQKISLGAELAGMMDAYCAMTRNRVYNPAVSHQRALESLVATRGKQFRPPLVDQFIQCMGLYPVGTLVELNTGEVGVIIQQNKVRRLQPRVLVVLAADKSIERYPTTLDLMMHPQTTDGETYRILRSLPPDAYGINPAELYLG